MKKEDRKYYALPDGTIREIPEGISLPNEILSSVPKHAMDRFYQILSNQPAIYTDDKFPVGLVEGIEVVYQDVVDGGGRSMGVRLFATRKREEVNTAINEETGNEYELKPDRFVQYLHLAKLKEEADNATGSTYWKLRCQYLEKSLDETYSIFERETCQQLYFMLRNKQP